MIKCYNSTKYFVTNPEYYLTIMTVEQIEKAILNLSEKDFSELRNWLLDLDYRQWDQQLEQDIMDEKLDNIASEALAEFESGDYQEI